MTKMPPDGRHAVLLRHMPQRPGLIVAVADLDGQHGVPPGGGHRR
ncbi:hypothetical protein ACWEO4_39415 [Streptomyces sp. NPDC004393]